MTEQFINEKPKRKPGRPSGCTLEAAQAAHYYIENYNSEFEHAIPTPEGMAIAMGVEASALFRWAREEDNEFTDILDKCKSHQHFALMDKGLKNEINSTIAKLALGKHGYNDKQETELKGILEITKIERTIVHPKNTDG